MTTVELTFTVPPALWITSNRMPTGRGHLKRVTGDLHDLAGWAARVRATTLTPPVRVTWTVHYAKGTGRADPSNTQPMAKRLLDGCVLAGLLDDDDSKHVVTETWQRGPNTSDETRVIVCTIEEVG